MPISHVLYLGFPTWAYPQPIALSPKINAKLLFKQNPSKPLSSSQPPELLYKKQKQKKTPKPSVVQERSPVWFSNDTIRHVHHAKYQSEPTSSDTFQYSSLSLKLMQYKY